jgi:glycosyltransferase involved in cell wall biosynthesis
MKPLPKVLFINHSVRDGGPGKSLFYLLKYLDREKVNPYVMVPKDDVFSERLKSEGIYENVIIDKRFPENLKRPRIFKETATQGIAAAIMKFISILLNLLDLTSLVLTSPYIIKKNGIDLIYCNGTQAKIAGALMGLVNGCPVIWHVRNIQQTKVLGSIIYTLARLPQVKRIICVSGPTANQFPAAREKLIVIHNGIDEEEYDPATTVGDLRSEYGIPARTTVVGSTGRIVPRKGYPLFVEAAQKYLEKAPDKNKNVKFVIVGDTPYFFQDNHLVNIKELVNKYELQNYFIFTGYRPDVKTSLKDFDIFVIPSNYPDPFPRSVIEAMSFALPVIGFKAGGIVEAVEDGVSGILNDSGDTEGMGEAILKLVCDKKLLRKMGKAGRDRVKEKFTAVHIAREIQDNILNVLGLK